MRRAKTIARYLNGVLLSVRSGVLTFAATDGRRLALVERPLEADSTLDGDIILPAKAANELSRSLESSGDVKILISQSSISFSTSETTVSSKLVEGTYPNYRQVIPKASKQQVTIPRQAFAETLRRVSLVVSDSSSSIKLTFSENALTVSANSAEVGESSEPVEIEYSARSLRFR